LIHQKLVVFIILVFDCSQNLTVRIKMKSISAQDTFKKNNSFAKRINNNNEVDFKKDSTLQYY